MSVPFADPRERILISTEIRQFFIHRRSRHFIPLILAGIFLAQWPYWGSPLAVVILVTAAGLEPQFNNILFRTPSELESLSVLPLSWTSVVKAKNIAAIVLLSIMLPIVAAVVLYFPATPVTPGQTVTAVWYILTIIFPLIHIGNLRSVANPRRESGWRFDDVSGAVELLLTLAVLSLPFAIIIEVLAMPSLCLLYFAATFIFWWRHSLVHTARLIENKRIEICLIR
jgi:hypothetical protein